MAIPIAMLIAQGLQQNQQMSNQNAASEAAGKTGMQEQIAGKRQQRMQAAEDVLPERNPTGLAGMDVMSPATSRQMQIFSNVLGKYRGQPQMQGGMV